MATSHNSAPHGDGGVVPQSLPPEGGYELYRYKNAERMKTKNWHGYYWARCTEEGDYEIRTVPRRPPTGTIPARHEGYQVPTRRGSLIAVFYRCVRTLDVPDAVSYPDV